VASGGRLDPSQERRDHIVWDDRGLITVTGGKLTTFRLIALDVLKAARRYLPGLDLRGYESPVFRRYEPVRTTHVAARVLARLEGRFGFLAAQFLHEADPDELQPLPGTDLLWAELRWAARHEHVAHLDDLLLRRTRLGILARQGGAEFLPRLGQICRAELGWSDARWDAEAVRYRDIWRDHYSLPPAEGARR
jgi:glycerol-3-phosphate dehydrogenase